MEVCRMFQGIDHLAIAAKDPAELAAWYRDGLGFKIVFCNDKTPPTLLVAIPGGGMLEIMPDNGRPVVKHELLDPGMRHLALRVTDFEAMHAKLQELQVTFVSDVVEASGGGKLISFEDPEGNVLQTVQRPAGFPS